MSNSKARGKPKAAQKSNRSAGVASLAYTYQQFLDTFMPKTSAHQKAALESDSFGQSLARLSLEHAKSQLSTERQ